MAFNGNEGSLISLNDAAAMTSAYRTNNPNGLKGYFFGKKIIKELLAQNECVGIRIYYAEDPDTGVQQMVLVGVDAEENDILAKVADLGYPCPTGCSAPNVLNS